LIIPDRFPNVSATMDGDYNKNIGDIP
jgi:hypothetical protein